MKTLIKKFTDSARELHSLRSLVTTAMLTALTLVLSLVVSINITDSLRISLSFLATAVCGMLYGPVCAGLSAGLADILQALIKPSGPFFPGFTLTAILSGVLFGLFFYHEKPTLLQEILCRFLINLFCNVALNGLWLKLLYNYDFWALLPTRLIKNGLLLPMEAGMLFLLLSAVRRLRKTVIQRSGK